MKKGLLIIVLFVSKISIAQIISLKAGHQISVTSTGSQTTSMMGMDMKSSTTTVNTIVVKEDVGAQYKVSNTLTKLKLSSDLPMQQINFDSDKKEDRESETGKALAASLDKPTFFNLIKKSGEVVSYDADTANETNDKSPFETMAGAIGGGTGSTMVSSAFFLIPPNKKTGDSWADSTTIENIKTVNHYTIDAIDKKMATIITNSIITGSTSIDLQGTQLNVDMNTSSTGKILVDISTSLVKSRSTTAAINSKVAMMGQSLPVTGTATSNITYE